VLDASDDDPEERLRWLGTRCSSLDAETHVVTQNDRFLAD
jgi:hypothetical protein